MALPLWAEPIRIATFNVEMQRKGPGLMLRDILRGDDQAQAVAQIVSHLRPDILMLQGVDYDADQHGLRALQDVIADAGMTYPHLFALRPNSGMATGLDMNGDGYLGDAVDKQGFGYFAGYRGMALLSRWPIDVEGVQDFSTLLWRDLPDATLPETDGKPFPSKAALAFQRLSYVGHWIVPIQPPSGNTITLMTFHATPPVFDGSEDQNGLRNADEIRLWTRVLDGQLGTAPETHFVILGTANLDPIKGEGRHEAIRDLLADPKLQDAVPTSAHGTDTVDWTDPKPGDMRVDYVLPSTDLTLIDASVFWPAPEEADYDLLTFNDTPASRHRLVWVDVVSGTADGS